MIHSCELQRTPPPQNPQENKNKKGISLSVSKKFQNQSSTNFKYIKLHHKII